MCTTDDWFSVLTLRRLPAGAERELGLVTLSPRPAGHVVLGKEDALLRAERARRRAGQAARDNVILDAQVWEDSGRYPQLQWYGDLDIAANEERLRRIAQLTGTTVYVGEYGGPPWTWPPARCRDRRVFTFGCSDANRNHPLAHLSRLDLRPRAKDSWRLPSSGLAVRWEPIGRALSPRCTMDFSRECVNTVASGELPNLESAHPAMPAALAEMRALILKALSRDGWPPSRRPPQDIIARYCKLAVSDVLGELRDLVGWPAGDGPAGRPQLAAVNSAAQTAAASPLERPPTASGRASR